MVVYENIFFDFEVFGRNGEMCVKTNTAQKYFTCLLGWSELRWNFSTLNKDGSSNYRFAKSKQKRSHNRHFFCVKMQFLLWNLLIVVYENPGQEETLGIVAFVRIVWCSCRVPWFIKLRDGSPPLFELSSFWSDGSEISFLCWKINIIFMLENKL